MKVKVINKSGFELPSYATDGAAGLDFKSMVEDHLLPGDSKLFKTGLYLEIPIGYELQLRSRSGLSCKNGIIVLNAPGTIDSDYRGEISILLHNTSSIPFKVEIGSRIAQGVFAAYEKITWSESEELTSSERGEGGFGSTGV